MADLDQVLKRISEHKVNRRGFLYAAGLTAGGAALAACTPGGAASEAPGETAGAIEDSLFMYNWSGYVDPANMDAFQKEFGVGTFTYDIYSNNEELIAKLQAGASGYDIACPTAEYVPGMVEEGFLKKLDLSRIPNQKHIDPAFLGLAWDPNNEIGRAHV